ncbi:MAG: class I SAM-dependent methyltransferase [Thermodesulfobacteriota bacterium]
MSLFSFLRFFRKGDKSHWEKIYSSHSSQQLGWYQESPEISLQFIADSKSGFEAHIIDVGGGTSRLAEMLLQQGYHNLTVFDISSQALNVARLSLAEKAERITWIEGDIISYSFDQQYDIWHDRAVFHFLTEAEDRQKYMQTLNRTLSANGHFIISTFSPEAPPKCSGIPVARYTPQSLRKEVGSGFELLDSREEFHRTPANTEQKFIYCLFKRSS